MINGDIHSDNLINHIHDLQKAIVTLTEQVNSLIHKKKFIYKFPTKTKTFHFSDDDIVYIKSDRNYSYLHFADGKDFPSKELTVSKAIGVVETQLNSEVFVRCHNSYIVNLNFISAHKPDGKGNKGVIFLKNRAQIPYSERYYQDLCDKGIIG